MMEELTKTNRLTITAILIVLVILAGLITLRRPDVKYKITPAESLSLLNDSSLMVNPEQASVLLKDSSGNVIFVDVRNSLAFEHGHLQNAVNIPVRELFSTKNKEFLKEVGNSGQIAVVYGETQQQATGPWLMMQQTGFKNAKLFTGNYSQLDPAFNDSLSRLLPQNSEIPLIDTTALKSISAAQVTDKSADKQVKPVKKSVTPVKKETSSGGGC